jgi:hypothetical protein
VPFHHAYELWRKLKQRNGKALERKMTNSLPHGNVETRGVRPVPARKIAAMAAPVEVVMHPNVYRIALLCWMALLSIFWVTFWVSSNALFMVAIGTVYAVVFFGVPYEMSRIFPGKRTSDKPLWTFLEEPFRTRTGTMKGYEVLLQVILVPLCLVIGGTCIGFIIRAARLAHQ